MRVCLYHPLALLGRVASARPSAAAASTPTAAAVTKTVIWSTVETQVTHPAWIAPPTVTIVTTRAYTTLMPESAAGSAGDGDDVIVETVLAHTTYEYRMVYSDGHRSTSWDHRTHSYVTTLTGQVATQKGERTEARSEFVTT